MNKVAVIGSINMDLVVETDISPSMGETVIGNDFFTSPGGKGANQAVAIARLGGECHLFGSIGNDANGVSLKASLESNQVITQYLNEVEQSTGCALIEVFQGKNKIIVVPGANQKTNRAYLESVLPHILEAQTVLIQMEIPMDSIEYIVDVCYEHGMTTVLNPAPASVLSENIVNKVTYLLPNEHEFELIFSEKMSEETVLKRYPNKLIITKGEQGVAYFDGNEVVTVPSVKVEAVDTTGAGDTFAGAFTLAVSEGKDLQNSIRFANAAAGLSVTKRGAQQGMPNRPEVNGLIKRV